MGGTETSVAATKSFLLAATSLLQLVAAWSADPVLADAVEWAPDALVATCALAVPGARALPCVDAPPVLAPLCAIQSFYLALPGLAAACGFDAEAPQHLRKVTQTR